MVSSDRLSARKFTTNGGVSVRSQPGVDLVDFDKYDSMIDDDEHFIVFDDIW